MRESSTAEPRPASAVARRGDPSGPVPLAERYRTLHVIGRGGMGRVELAVERVGAHAGRVVALKRLLPDAVNDPRLTEMFLREARLAALLSHPNVVHAFDYGELAGELFLAMEYVEGEPLSRVLAEGKGRGVGLEPVLAAHVLAEISLGLHAAHELRDAGGTRLGVVHRDVSPHNVMVAYDGGVKLLDFGVAKTDEKGGLTRTGEVKGKVAYMSPEQAMGEALDRRSDLYSLGAVLFECLTGRRMWPGTDMEVLRQLALEEPPRLDVHAPGAPSALCALHLRLVARDPAARPATAAEVADTLIAYVRSSGADSPPAALEARMNALFAEAARARRDALASALATPETAASADAIEERGERFGALEPRAEARVSPASAGPDDDGPRRPRRTARRAAASATVVVAALACALAIARTRMAGPVAASTSGAVAPPPAAASLAPLANPVPPVDAAFPKAAAPSPSAPSPVLPSRSPPPSPSRARTRPGPKAAAGKPSPAPSPPPETKRIDVDPDPI